MINIAVVEDEKAASDALVAYIGRYEKESGESFRIVTYPDAKTLLAEMEESRSGKLYDIVFMDILLPYMNGMDASHALRAIDKTFVLIFVTNMSNFAVKGYEVGALDFVVKPVVYGSFAMKMDKAVAAVKGRGTDVMIRTAGGLKVIPASDVRYVEVNNHHLVYHTADGELRVRKSMAAAEEELKGCNFAKCNVCYLINLDYVTEVDSETVTVGGDKLKISRAKKKEFMSWLTKKLGRTR